MRSIIIMRMFTFRSHFALAARLGSTWPEVGEFAYMGCPCAWSGHCLLCDWTPHTCPQCVEDWVCEECLLAYELYDPVLDADLLEEDVEDLLYELYDPSSDESPTRCPSSQDDPVEEFQDDLDEYFEHHPVGGLTPVKDDPVEDAVKDQSVEDHRAGGLTLVKDDPVESDPAEDFEDHPVGGLTPVKDDPFESAVEDHFVEDNLVGGLTPVKDGPAEDVVGGPPTKRQNT